MVILYIAAIVAANLSVAAFGPWVTPINAFLLIGLDLSLRDRLHLRLSPLQMGAMILGAGAISFLLNPDAGRIAAASAISFVVAGVADWAVFAALSRSSWLRRSNCSNVAGAAVDSLVFPTLAFGGLMPGIVAAQFAAKVAGGALWSLILHRRAA